MIDGFRRVEGKTITFWPETASSINISDEMICALLEEKQNSRVCFHLSPHAALHDMLIAEWRDLYTFPLHRHPKPETIQILRGSMALRLGSGLVRHNLFRDHGIHIPVGVWHQTVPSSEYVVYREIKPGPFQPSDNEFWTGDDPE
jgi:cupin fold WbuC family metalloprotein